MSTRQDYVSAIGYYVNGSNLPLGTTEKEFAIAQAILEHSRHRPQILVQDVDGDGSSFDFNVTNLTSWSQGFSVIKQLEYPVDDDDETPNLLQEYEWTIYHKPTGYFIRFLRDTPSSDEDFRATYTALHTCTDSACTVEDYDEKVVQMLASAYFCFMLSTYYAKTNDASISADSVNHTSRSSEYKAKGSMYESLYYDHLGAKKGSPAAASTTYDWDYDGSWASDKLTHRRHYR